MSLNHPTRNELRHWIRQEHPDWAEDQVEAEMRIQHRGLDTLRRSWARSQQRFRCFYLGGLDPYER